jgi:hypothetical protein
LRKPIVGDVADIAQVRLNADIQVSEDALVDSEHLVLARTIREDERALAFFSNVLMAAFGRIPMEAAEVGFILALKSSIVS